MRGRIPDDIIERIRRDFDILDVVQQYVQVKKSGRNYFGLCPFHSEKSPSFSVSPEKQIFHCFGCGAGGDTIKFVMDIEQMTFIEAVRHLAEQAGIHIPESGPALSGKEEEERQQMREALNLASQLYHHVLIHTEYGTAAREYLKQREVSSDTIEEFQLGFAPPSYQFLLQILKRRGFQEELLEKAGLIATRDSPSQKKYFDRFRGRIMFPIHDSQGRIIGFGGRIIGEGQPKYLNSPETPFFHKGNHLFNLHRARNQIRKEQQAIVFEGYMDAITAWQSGIRNVIATLGTSFTDDQARVVKRNASTVVICYDADSAGQSAALRGLEILSNHDCTVKVAQMPIGMDPDDYIRRHGGTAFKEEIVAASLSLTAFKLESLKKDYNLRDEDERMKYLAKAIDVISGLPLAIEQDHYMRRLAEEFQLSLEAIKEEQRKRRSRKRREAKRDKEHSKWNNGYHEISKRMIGRSHPVSVAEKSEMLLIAHMMRDKAVADWVKSHLGADFNTEIYAALAAYLYAYYEHGYPEDAGSFIRYLPNESLIPKASELAMLELPDEVSEEALLDYVRHIRNYPLLKEIEQKEKMVQQLSRADEPVKAAQLSLEITRLRKQLQLRMN
ncbi:DNA primase [Paenactinomyces guangxiensis]|uniref:DNA primase n=1 Tax=Paenactinomyces guangxiensis TaxID=1490290 RepID=A0A7W2A6A7_9BACL|nr:DNA primase [Paenactinomyces guangxiensis]MBA4493171.1 DNA primase [Paenactinomyces guangxiensis]MBH8589979.1 DNA primase [Paenactinomyces guangxiensis]